MAVSHRAFRLHLFLPIRKLFHHYNDNPLISIPKRGSFEKMCVKHGPTTLANLNLDQQSASPTLSPPSCFIRYQLRHNLHLHPFRFVLLLVEIFFLLPSFQTDCRENPRRPIRSLIAFYCLWFVALNQHCIIKR